MHFYQLLTMLLILILPLIPNQSSKLVYYAIGAFTVLLLPCFLDSVRRWRKNSILFFFAMFLLSGALATIFSLDQTLSLRQLIIFFCYFIVFTTIASIFPNFKSKVKLAAALVFASILPSIVSLYNTVVLHMVNREPDGISFLWIYFGHNHLSALLIFTLPLAFYLLFFYWNKLQLRFTLLLACLLLLVAFFFTLARASILSLFFAILSTSLFFVHLSLPRKSMILIALGITFAFSSLFIVRFAGEQSIRYYKEKLRLPIEQNNRFIFWSVAIDNARKYPLTGSGFDTFRIVIYRQSEAKYKTPYVHNFFLQMLSDSGILGFLSSVGLIGSVLWKAVKKLKSQNLKLKTEERYLLLALFTGILASTLNSFVDADWQIPFVFFIFWITAGLFNPVQKQQ